MAVAFTGAASGLVGTDDADAVFPLENTARQRKKVVRRLNLLNMA
jgi:hypothetical protein